MMMRNSYLKKCLIFLIVFTLFIYVKNLYFKESSLSSNIKKISKEDQQKLTLLFDEAIRWQQLGFSLFGDKPISILGYFTDLVEGNILWGASKKQLNSYWKTWKKYEHFFPIKNYLLLDEEQPMSRMRTITLINKRAFLEKTREHLNYFKQVLGNDFTPENFLSKLEQEGANLFELLHRDESLYGILLGFGKNNALNFKRYMEIEKYFMPYEHTGNQVSLHLPKPSLGFRSIEEEREFICNKLEDPTYYHSNTQFIRPVIFGGDPGDPETIELRKKYAEMRKKLSEIYSKGNILEITLKQLTS